MTVNDGNDDDEDDDDDDDKIVVYRTIYSIFDGFLLRSVCHTEEHP